MTIASASIINARSNAFQERQENDGRVSTELVYDVALSGFPDPPARTEWPGVKSWVCPDSGAPAATHCNREAAIAA